MFWFCKKDSHHNDNDNDVIIHRHCLKIHTCDIIKKLGKGIMVIWESRDSQKTYISKIQPLDPKYGDKKIRGNLEMECNI